MNAASEEIPWEGSARDEEAEMEDLTPEQEESARRITEVIGLDLPSAREAVAIADGVIEGCVIEV